MSLRMNKAWFWGFTVIRWRKCNCGTHWWIPGFSWTLQHCSGFAWLLPLHFFCPTFLLPWNTSSYSEQRSFLCGWNLITQALSCVVDTRKRLRNQISLLAPKKNTACCCYHRSPVTMWNPHLPLSLCAGQVVGQVRVTIGSNSGSPTFSGTSLSLHRPGLADSKSIGQAHCISFDYLAESLAINVALVFIVVVPLHL